MTKKLRIIPLGGLGEIGKNMTVLEYGRNMIVVDCGVMFPENDMYGIDLVDQQTVFAGSINLWHSFRQGYDEEFSTCHFHISCPR